MKNDKDKITKVTADADTAVTAEKPMGGATQKRKTKRWTAVDTIIVLLLVLAVGGVVLRGVVDWNKQAETPVTGPFYVEFSVAEIHPTVLGEIAAFDPLYLYESGELVGYVGVYDDGTMALHTVGQLSSLNGGIVSAEGCMVCLEGVYENGSLLVTGMDQYLSPGTKLTLRTDRAVLTVEITGIRSDR